MELPGSPAWRPDPLDPRRERLWDGSAWTERVRETATSNNAAIPSSVPVIDSPVEVVETFGSAIREGFQKFADFSGRSSAKSFWNFWLFQVVISVVAVALLGAPGLVVVVILFFPGLSYVVRRLHDRGKPGAYALLAFIPVLGLLLLLVELAGPGEPNPNDHGAAAKSMGTTGDDAMRVGPGGGTIIYDSGEPGDPHRYVEMAPMGWMRVAKDPELDWNEAKHLLESDPRLAGAGWRLPTLADMEWVAEHRKQIPGYANGAYWTSEEWGRRKAVSVSIHRQAWAFSPKRTKERKSHRLLVRPVRTLSSL